jgi:hypothetical protein
MPPLFNNLPKANPLVISAGRQPGTIRTVRDGIYKTALMLERRTEELASASIPDARCALMAGPWQGSARPLKRLQKPPGPDGQSSAPQSSPRTYPSNQQFLPSLQLFSTFEGQQCGNQVKWQSEYILGLGGIGAV